MVPEASSISENTETDTLIIEAQSAKWGAVISSVVDAIIIIDEAGCIQEANPATAKLFGHDVESLLGENVSVLMPEPYHSQHDDYVKRYLETGEKWIMDVGREVLAMHKSGKVFPIALSVSEVRYDDTRLFVGVIRDLTERKANEERLIEAQKTEAIAQLTAGIAHDFNNLLTVVQGNLEMLEAIVPQKEGQVLLEEVLGAIEDGSYMVRQLLAFGRKQTLRPEVTDINDLVQRLLRLLKRTLSESITIKSNLADGLPPLNIDPGQLENALLNLVINARDALADGGEILVETGLIERASLISKLGQLHPKGSFVQIAVSDNGSGMPDDVLASAFEPFFSTKKTGKGSGLGLSMVYGFVKQSGGDIDIESQPGKGTVVTLILPSSSSEIRASASKSSLIPTPTPGTGDGETILLVEDDAKVRRVNVRRLVALGYRVLEADNGPSALAVLAENEQVVALFSDIVMPGGMLGQELAGHACQMRPELKVILTTGYADEPARTGAVSYAVLTKPYSSLQLAQQLRSVLLA